MTYTFSNGSYVNVVSNDEGTFFYVYDASGDLVVADEVQGTWNDDLLGRLEATYGM